MQQVVLIGAGHASASAAKTLRREGFAGTIIVVGDEAYPPYQRPMLSKEFLLEDAEQDELWSMSEDWCRENDVTLMLGRRADRIDIEQLAVELADGERLPADAVLIATGVQPRRLPSAPSPRVHYLKTLDEALALRGALREGARVAIVGGGFIGLEIAAAARSRDCAVTLFEADKLPLARILGDELGAAMARLHADNGVDLRTGVKVAEIVDLGDAGIEVVTDDGQRHQADIAVVGIGVTPNDAIARVSEITVGNGIRVDQFCRTSAIGVFAAGDVANHYHPGLDTRLRVEHFDNASRQGAAAARNMLGQRVVYDDVHWFWSDQYDHGLQFVGHAADYDRIVVRGDVDAFDFAAFYMKGDRVVAAFGIDRGAEILAAKSLIADKVPVDDAQLADEDVDLLELGSTEAADEVDDELPQTPDALADTRFERVARSGQVTEGNARRFMIGETEVAVARWEGKVYALHNLCTHLACRLTAGKVDQAGLTCLCHGSIFELATGFPVNPPATKPVRTFPVIETEGQIYVRVRD
ncbi:FAD-dependent oxidoreductase [Novosphingobium mangrovi (ex Huang et al. 2023)]|uniref:FAD-dependent oxidoreductase n=1 Tax=Novosphingobium mangrovi (ex Huang et al. 2023) TaxID=2976432 RepID=A0ABT2I0Z1_9SPHN|nr:FAD-dependent oxidoreductase [Novosphingobium mangrovi (ex Huang et al. 2023)]MCT2398471.1 FAD-dependent oxidoreductase [Novosphingobium mangrovi (ex Huang et al. 2023)]